MDWEKQFQKCIEQRDQARNELAALREELATAKRNEHNDMVAYKAVIERQNELRNELGECKGEYDRAVNRLTAAEQRNSAVIDILSRFVELQKSDYAVRGGMSFRWQPLIEEAEAAIKPSESGAREWIAFCGL